MECSQEPKLVCTGFYCIILNNNKYIKEAKLRRVTNAAQIRLAGSMPAIRSKGTAGTARSDCDFGELSASIRIMRSPK